MKISFLDAKTLGDDVTFDIFPNLEKQFSTLVLYPMR